MKDKLKYAKDYIKEVKKYFENMPVLTDDEQAMYDGAVDALSKL